MIPPRESAALSGIEAWLRQTIRDEVARATSELSALLRSIEARLAGIESAASSITTSEYLSVARAARIAGVSTKTIGRWIGKRLLPAHGPRHNRLDPRELDAFMRGRTRDRDLDTKTDDDHAREILERGRTRRGR